MTAAYEKLAERLCSRRSCRGLDRGQRNASELVRGRHVRAVFVAGRHRGSEEAEEASPQVDELIDAKQFATTMGVGIGGVVVQVIV